MSDQFQIEMISLEELVPLDSDYRKFVKLFNFKKIDYRLKKLEKTLGRTGYGMIRLFKCLLYQFMEDLSDRELEMSLKTNNVSKWFCGFSLKYEPAGNFQESHINPIRGGAYHMALSRMTLMPTEPLKNHLPLVSCSI